MFNLETHRATNPAAAARIAGHLEGKGYKTFIIRPSDSNPYYTVTGGKPKSTAKRRKRRM